MLCFGSSTQIWRGEIIDHPPVEEVDGIYRRLKIMNKALIAKATVTIDAPVAKVWEAITNPELIWQYLFGAEVITDWKEGTRSSTRVYIKGKRMRTKAMFLKWNLKNYFLSLIGRPCLVQRIPLKTIIR